MRFHNWGALPRRQVVSTQPVQTTEQLPLCKGAWLTHGDRSSRRVAAAGAHAHSRLLARAATPPLLLLLPSLRLVDAAACCMLCTCWARPPACPCPCAALLRADGKDVIKRSASRKNRCAHAPTAASARRRERVQRRPACRWPSPHCCARCPATQLPARLQLQARTSSGRPHGASAQQQRLQRAARWHHSHAACPATRTLVAAAASRSTATLPPLLAPLSLAVSRARWRAWTAATLCST